MGKKVKKGRTPHKDKRITTNTRKKSSEPSNESSTDGVVLVPKEKRVCPHFEKGVALDALTAKFESREEASQCEDCREGAVDRRAGKSKGKHGKSKGSVWVCLACGHFSCGGIGLPTSPKSHALYHCRQTRHPLALQLENPHLLWCFPCSSILKPEKMEENEEQNKVILSVKKLIKGHGENGSMVNVEDDLVGFASNDSEKKRGGYVARGLVNLGNTCYFNSVLQNLLTTKKLRDYFLTLDLSVGPLTSTLKKIFVETLPESGLRNVINPRAFFSNVCSKSPQFGGFLQHDSHELLRCLLDGLSLEETAMRKTMDSPKENGTASSPVHTFVDAVFGGQLSSTVCCLECGHCSTVYEPYLDLSLPVPTKKPTSKKTQQAYRSKKPKLPPKKLAKNRPKLIRSVGSVSDASDSKDQSHSCSSGPSNCSGESTSVVQNLPQPDERENKPIAPTEECENKQAYEDKIEQVASFLDDFSWMDYLEPDNNDSSVENRDAFSNNVPEQSVSESGVQISQVNGEPEPEQEPDTKPRFSSVNPWEDEILPVTQSSEALLLPYKDDNSSESGVQISQLNDEPEEDKKPRFSSVNPWEDEILPMAQSSEALLLPYKDDNSSESVVQISKVNGEPEPEQEPDTKPRFSSVNPWEDEILPVVQSSEVLLLPYIDDNTSEAGVQISKVNREPEPEQEPETKPQLSSVNPWEDEILPVVQSSEVLLLPYIDDNSSSAVELEAKQDDFDGFAAMFDEPEVFIGPVAGPETRFTAANSSESDPDEVDNSDLPVSVETCLAHFTKPEILSKENAWHCENCSKSALREKSHTIKQSKIASEALINLDSAPGCSNDQTDELVNESEDASSSYHTCGQESLSNKATDSGCSSEAQKVNPISMEIPESVESEEEDEVDSETIKVKRDASKRVLINKAPQVLTIHLKRFSQDHRGRLNKLTGHIAFGEVVDLKPYIDSRCEDDERYDYRLVGVVEHQGNMRGGHYVAYVRGKQNDGVSVWFHASDAYVRETNLDEVLRCDAYILFYEKVET